MLGVFVGYGVLVPKETQISHLRSVIGGFRAVGIKVEEIR